jgi:hypothetical protein
MASHLELTDNYSRTSFNLSYKPLISHAKHASIVSLLLKRVTSLLTRSRDPSPLLRHPSVYSCCLATNEATRCATRLGTEKTPLRLLLRIRESVFRCYSSCMVSGVSNELLVVRTEVRQEQMTIGFTQLQYCGECAEEDVSYTLM